MNDEEAGELMDWLLQTLHAGEIALDAIARGEIPDGWEETARQLSAAHIVCPPNRDLAMPVSP